MMHEWHDHLHIAVRIQASTLKILRLMTTTDLVVRP
jgi:hypothetical protein